MFRQKVNLSLESSTSIGVKGAKREELLIKHHIPRDIDSPFGGIKTLEAFMHGAITKEGAGIEWKASLRELYCRKLGQQAQPKTRRDE